MKADIEKHAAPVRRYIRAADVDGLPDVAPELRSEICGCIRIPNTLDEDGTELWHVTFAWPTFSESQDQIKELVEKLDCCEQAEDLPAAFVSIEVSEQAEAVDMGGSIKDGQITQAKVTTVTKTLREHASSFCFAAER